MFSHAPAVPCASQIFSTGIRGQRVTSIRRVFRPISTGKIPRVVTVAAKSKAAEFRELTADQIDEKVMDLRKKMYFLRAARAEGKEVKSHEFQATRKTIARLLTVKRQQEIDEGVDRRESLRREKKKLLESGWLRKKAYNVPIKI